MTYEVRLLPKAEKTYRDAERSLARKLARCFEQLERDPRRHNNIRRLKGQLAGLYRYRIGDELGIAPLVNNRPRRPAGGGLDTAGALWKN